MLLHNHRQVHVLVNATVQMVSTSRIEWPNGLTLTRGTELQIAHGRRTGFCCWPGDTIHPGPIANDMCHVHIIDQIEAAALTDGHRRLREGCIAHVNISLPTTRTAATGCNQDRD